MYNLTLIAAIGKNNELGIDNHLIWYLPNDLKFFKSQTIHKKIVMGINTFNSLPKLLPQRKHIILTHQNIEETEDIMVFHDKETLLAYLKTLDEEIMVIGGAKIYSEFMKDATKMVLTIVDDEKKADAYFPTFNEGDWEKNLIDENNDNGISYKHYIYIRRGNK